MFLVPDEPEVTKPARRAGGTVVPQSLQTTNSWGCRGPEPDPTAPVRVLVLGDSMMQGALVGDSDTPPAKLESHLGQALETRVSVLNTGHIGYSLEQYDQTLRALGDRFEPHFVVISVCENDFGDLNDPAAGPRRRTGPAGSASSATNADGTFCSCPWRIWPLSTVPGISTDSRLNSRRSSNSVPSTTWSFRNHLSILFCACRMRGTARQHLWETRSLTCT